MTDTQDPLATLREIEAEGPHPVCGMHYALAVTGTIRRALQEFAKGSPVDTVGDCAYRVEVIVAGRLHYVTVQPGPV